MICRLLLAEALIYCLAGFSSEAMDTLVAAGPGVALGAVVYDHIIRALLATGALEDAMTVRDM